MLEIEKMMMMREAVALDSDRERIAQAMEALTSMGMGDYADKDYQTLSEGQKQLVILARLLVEDSALLLLDEPDSALDFQNRYAILWQLKKLTEERQRCALLCLHDPILALEFCQQLILLKDGNISPCFIRRAILCRRWRRH